MTELSPAAQAIMDAFYEGITYADEISPSNVAAAMRAAADQVAPFPGRYPLNEYMEGIREAKRRVRTELLAIAHELEVQ
jgi:hypothetical protein